jgi:hypothetical protein
VCRARRFIVLAKHRAWRQPLRSRCAEPFLFSLARDCNSFTRPVVASATTWHRICRTVCVNFGFGALIRGPLPIIDEAHGERLASNAVSKRLGEGQGGAALERLRHGRLI